jgi:hypothetical protein
MINIHKHIVEDAATQTHTYTHSITHMHEYIHSVAKEHSHVNVRQRLNQFYMYPHAYRCMHQHCECTHMHTSEFLCVCIYIYIYSHAYKCMYRSYDTHATDINRKLASIN